MALCGVLVLVVAAFAVAPLTGPNTPADQAWDWLLRHWSGGPV